MQNITPVTVFLFTAYEAKGNIKYLYFTVTLLTYFFIVFVNTVLITTIIRERKLHKPMYIFICNLSLNGLYGSTAFYPNILANLLSETPSISRAGCMIQIFCTHTYGSFEYSILALMGYDRYVSICHPLMYNSIMTPLKVTQLLVSVYMYPACIMLIHVVLTVQLPLCGFIIDKVYCDNWSVVRLACSNVSVNSAFGLFVTVIVMCLPFAVIIYSYVRILAVCLKFSKEARAKALQTCTPHLLSFTNYSLASFFEILQHRFDLGNMPHLVRAMMSINPFLLPPLLNPIIYGVKLQEIRIRTMKIFLFLFNSYVAKGNIKYLYFMVTLLIYLLIVFVNTVLITTIARERKLHEPMYIFICNLSLNGVYGSTAFYPNILANLLIRNYSSLYIYNIFQSLGSQKALKSPLRQKEGFRFRFRSMRSRCLLNNRIGRTITMQNSSYVTILYLTAYDTNGNIRYLYFTGTLFVFLFILFGNVIIITVITRERKLHEPMYIFICNLTLNGVYGSTAFYPHCLSNLLSETPSISRSGCLIQVYCLHTYGGFEYSILALMAYDRYVSICYPLMYNSIMTPLKVTQLLFFVYMYPACIMFIHLILTIRLPLCGFIIDNVYCDNWSVVRLSCSDVSVNNIFGLFVTSILMGVPLTVIIYSYGRILAVCMKSSKEARAKALQTCSPHLLSFTNYSIATFFEVLHLRFDLSNMPQVVRILLSMDCILLPPLLNPIIYGIKLQEIRKRTMKMFFGRKTTFV
ncbi:O52D1 protein, partial [Atractosteus spatula]|nr:O52D1 protein [Atractosteus spatula]